MALITTIGDENSNSYVSIDYVNEYLLNRPFAEAWDAEFDQEKFLIAATRLLDWSFKYNGEKVTSTQALQWPRIYSYDYKNNIYIDESIIPEQIKQATCEIIIVSLDEDRLTENDLLGLERIRMGSMEVEVNKYYNSQSKKNPVPDIVYSILNGIISSNSSGIFKRIVRF